MKSWKRITLVISILIGSVTFFSYWSINQFNQAFDNLNASHPANIRSVGSAVNPAVDPELSFTFPQKYTGVYIGCNYPISWQSSTTIISLEAALVDAGTKEAVGQEISGLAKESAIERDPQSLTWKVGVVWPGEYYIAVSKINDVVVDNKSDVFIISRMPVGVDEEEKVSICRKYNG